MRKLAAALISACLTLAVTGCGAERAEPPDLGQTEAPGAAVPYASPSGDVAFSYPVNWTLVPKQPPGTATVASGDASITVWAYQSVAGVTDPGSAGLARRRLLKSLQGRDPSFKVTSSRVRQVAGAPAVEIRGTGQIGGAPVQVRSLHLYVGRGEYVIDAFAPPEAFADLESTVFEPFISSVVVKGNPVPPGAPAAPVPPPGT